MLKNYLWTEHYSGKVSLTFSHYFGVANYLVATIEVKFLRWICSQGKQS